MQTTAPHAATTHPTSGPRPATYGWHMPANWWLQNKRYFAYMVRELTAVFAALWVILLLVQLPAMAAGPQNPYAHNGWVEFVHSPEWVLFSIVAFFLVGYHAWTWFNLMGTVLYLRMGKTAIPSRLIVLSMFLAWIGASIIVAFFIATPIVGG